MGGNKSERLRNCTLTTTAMLEFHKERGNALVASVQELRW